MGSFTYDGLVVTIEDRTLAHLQLVMVQKLRRGESFLLSWNNSVEVGSGRSAVWMHPTIPIRFKFSGNKNPSLNEVWLRDLIAAANSPRGLVILEESGEAPTVSSGAASKRETSMTVPVKPTQAVTS